MRLLASSFLWTSIKLIFIDIDRRRRGGEPLFDCSKVGPARRHVFWHVIHERINLLELRDAPRTLAVTVRVGLESAVPQQRWATDMLAEGISAKPIYSVHNVIGDQVEVNYRRLKSAACIL